MNAKQIADELENIYWIQGDGKGKPFQQYADLSLIHISEPTRPY